MPTIRKAIILTAFCLVAVQTTFSQTLNLTPVADIAAPADSPPILEVTEIPFEASVPVPDLNLVVNEVCDFQKGSVQGFNYEVWLNSPLPTPELKKDTLILN